ncbi:TM2 domain-containing protein 3-like [Panonychus citri]|uniref:TM2 domain-containing protein 3-like n=1 Tax=Panonychus citri TaxID=50023 RepID=UPI0023079A76|nr:TM2 domain-containing protein 3-like [Panonychus citri]XP_053208775.1 TM2 domain-containing protein 3-like [Panonychus citri]
MYLLLSRYLLIVLLCLVFSSKYQLKARDNDIKDILFESSNVYGEDNLVNENDPSELNFAGSSKSDYSIYNLLSLSSNSVPSSRSSPLSSSKIYNLSPSHTSLGNDDSKSSNSHHQSIPSTLPFSASSPSTSTTIADEKSDDSNGAVDSKFYRTLCSTNRLQSCQNLSIDCLDCEYDYYCDFGEVKTASCRVKEGVECQGPKLVHHNYTCAYCYQLPESNYYCMSSFACRINSRYLTDCSMKPHVPCLGNRSFQRYKLCNFVSGYKWSTALLLSVTLGGFGIDRFYLGYWQEGIGKLFSFGGFGVWTLVDIILISTGYLKPADGSRYINDFSFS